MPNPSKDKPSPRSSPGRSGGQKGENLSAKGGRESHKNDPFPPPKDAIDKTSASDPTDAARKGGQHSHTGGNR
jgi:hypothetical protein